MVGVFIMNVKARREKDKVGKRNMVLMEKY
jgi:hypothetical protein